MRPEERDKHVLHYFKLGHSYAIISCYMYQNHSVSISVRTVKRILNEGGHRRNGIGRNLQDPQLTLLVVDIQRETNNKAGYRRVWNMINYRHNLRVTQETVRRKLLEVDPLGVRRRCQRVLLRRSYYAAGPNHVWHMDGYDKLKPYGFAIHACIDGYSRKLMWINCSSSNNDPSIILHYYLATVEKLDGIPVLLRSDCGTETGKTAATHCTLADDRNVFVYGPSHRNQRIEAWWSKLRTAWTETWLDLFDELAGGGCFQATNEVCKSIAQFCFMDIINLELAEIVRWWNSHRIRRTSTSGCPGGIPNELYDIPWAFGAREFRRPLDKYAMNLLRDNCRNPPSNCDTVIEGFCKELCESEGWAKPRSKNDALDLYIKLYSYLVT